MAFENKTGLNVHNHYGPRGVGTSIGVEHSQDSIHQLSIAFTGKSLANSFLPPVVIPKGALFKRAVLRVDEAFVVTGTNPTLIFGELGDEATNGIVLTEAELEAVGTKTPASSGTGTWAFNSATGTTAAKKIGKALGGTNTPAISTAAGAATLTIEYFYKAKK